MLPASRAGVDFFVNVDFYMVVADVNIVTVSYAFGWEGIVSPLLCFRTWLLPNADRGLWSGVMM
jgi:hypothetical protein